MKSLKKYSIPFTGLKLGKHLFEYDIQDDFFDGFEYSLVKKATLHCEIELDKQETMLILNFKIDGTVETTCDRCLKALPIQLDITEQQIAKFSDEEIDEDEEIITLGKNDHEIDVAGLIYEYINVAVPFISICGEGNTSTCDQEMLDKLKSLSANGEQSEQTDPRWDALRNMNK
ncbi:uncharacterized metal-binding protein YceD (DUF177 family) [Mucilaginibacter oryzae]|uniref:Uncharacterized metal-binding protein YceD (DUF177 family) n=1 Tax=Mucilaginibacter oryzae TaxID=468058 RepID=A0A316GXK5_9SPHI|nr:DUF177 domain-containing protein [Mucilaginibacter oryzae]PWK69269.1 uncharacterized metal-binding protein YceD (DUF177 family) [Mucilaginibacter oryzae]